MVKLWPPHLSDPRCKVRRNTHPKMKGVDESRQTLWWFASFRFHYCESAHRHRTFDIRFL